MSRSHAFSALAIGLVGMLATTGAASAQDEGFVFADTVVVEEANGLYRVTKDLEVCFDPACPGADCCEDGGRPNMITMMYTAEGCDPGGNDQGDSFECEDFGALPDTVYIIASKDEDCGGDIFFAGTVSLGGTYVIDGDAPLQSRDNGDDRNGSSSILKSMTMEATGAPAGSSLQPADTTEGLPSSTYICIFDQEGGTLLQQVKFHTSCSKPLSRGDRFGASTLVDCVGEDEPDPNDGCCAGKPVILSMTYTGSDCDPDGNQQGDRFECDDFGALPDPAYIIAARKDFDCDDPDPDLIYFAGDVNIGGEFIVDAGVIGEDKLDSETILCFYDMEGGQLLQAVNFHTSCSRPLNLGDRFGGATLNSVVGEDGVCEPPPIPCDPFPMDGLFTYTYKLTNDGPLGIIGYEIVLPDGTDGVVVDAGVIENGGVVPSGVTIESNRVEWDFFDPAIAPGEMSAILYITSPLGPGEVDVSVSGQAGLDTPFTNYGPTVECNFCEDGIGDQCYSCPEGPAEGLPCPVDCCPDGGDRPRGVRMVYTAEECDDSGNQQEGGFECDQFLALPDTVYVIASKSNNCDDEIYFEGTVSIGDEFLIDANAIGNDELGSATYMCFYDMQGGTLLQHVNFHTSCSKPLFTGDRFGGATLLECIPQDP